MTVQQGAINFPQTHLMVSRSVSRSIVERKTGWVNDVSMAVDDRLAGYQLLLPSDSSLRPQTIALLVTGSKK